MPNDWSLCSTLFLTDINIFCSAFPYSFFTVLWRNKNMYITAIKSQYYYNFFRVALLAVLGRERKPAKTMRTAMLLD